MALPTTTSSARPFTYEDLEGMPHDGYRREIIGGSLIVSPSPVYRHQRVLHRLAVLLAAGEPEDMRMVGAPFDWLAPDGDVVVPDFVVMRADDVDPRGPLGRGRTPLLLVEVLSPSNRNYDLLTKRAVYEAAGVPAYWIIDPAAPGLVALRLSAGRYQTEAEVTGDDRFTTGWPYPVTFAPTELLR